MHIHHVTIRGTRPFLMHNGQLKDPLNPWAKKLKVATSKKAKSDEDTIEIGRIEFEGSMYFHEKIGPIIPVDNLQSCLVEGARKRKLGKQFEALIEVVEPEDGAEGYKLQYDGPRDIEAMWQDARFRFRKDAKIGQSSVMRTRPRFPTGWKCKFDIEVLDGGATPDQVKQAVSDAGILVGIGDWTPKYGRFAVEKFD